ncbi:hypothetical protein AVEN_30256-1 [Araneus ventricosus]|uniref:Uncharacterized protein n=1 Tax=Araneus ventricosus TaxID=182803 RepID=A0A4Y2PIN9_ARAVE|nr:hypothetical protein AVEN_30256-1 [Araneus ventricosus]
MGKGHLSQKGKSQNEGVKLSEESRAEGKGLISKTGGGLGTVARGECSDRLCRLNGASMNGPPNWNNALQMDFIIAPNSELQIDWKTPFKNVLLLPNTHFAKFMQNKISPNQQYQNSETSEGIKLNLKFRPTR